MKLRERFYRHGREGIRTVIIQTPKPVIFRDDMTTADVATLDSSIWLKAEWLQDHWFIPTRWGVSELIPALKRRRVDPPNDLPSASREPDAETQGD